MTATSLLTWSENAADIKTFTEHPLIGQIPALANVGPTPRRTNVW